jgi:hypothetical protein
MTIHGNKGYVTIDADELKVKNFTLTISAPLADDTDMGDEWEKKLPGAPKSWSGSLTCSLKKADAAQTALTPGAQVTVSLYSNGNGSGETYHTGTAFMESVDRNQDFSDASGITFNFVGSGALTEETVV